MADLTPEENPAVFDAPAVETVRRAIAHRRSLGLARLKPDPVEPRLIEMLLDAANWAPSHGDTEPWRFTVFAGEGRRALGEAFGEAYRRETADDKFKPAAFEATRDKVWSAPVWIAIGMTPALRPDGTPQMRQDEEIMAVACAVQNLHLLASTLGLAGMWHSKGTSSHPYVAEFLGLAPPSRLLGFFFFGWPDVPWPAGERRPLAEKVRWIVGKDDRGGDRGARR